MTQLSAAAVFHRHRLTARTHHARTHLLDHVLPILGQRQVGRAGLDKSASGVERATPSSAEAATQTQDSAGLT